ncbi:hypothetical protein OG349_12100 [Streptomyces sp. NBC_01317]|uniref:hypothetical protein n=1 Tax=Streptomyces sp. NBC_01317 TaxID=2903822 RepID=UPI002E0E2568|nr:hypothetical protein OG349_12100 [Streptomyces sp. NBC_01317]
MTADPTDRDETGETDEIGTETPEDDAAEQRADVRPDEDEASDGPLGADPAEADEGDAAEQARAVTLDEDEYR